MSAMVCGSKRALFDDQTDSPTPLGHKRVRRWSPSSSPAPPLSPSSAFDRLLAQFPHAEPQMLERALQECGNDLDVAIQRLNEMAACSAGDNGNSAPISVTNVDQGVLFGKRNECDVSATPSGSEFFAENAGAEWVKAIVDELSKSTSLEEMRIRATHALEIFERSISSRVGEEARKTFQKENVMLKEQMEVHARENTILKRAVAIFHERQKECEDKNQELQHLKQAVSQCQEQIRVLEVNNYALKMHLRQAEQSNAWPGWFNPDVF